MDAEPRYCDTRLWMEGKEDACRQVIEAMPAEQRQRWKRILFSRENPNGPAREGLLYAVFVREGRWTSLPLTDELLEDGEAVSLASHLIDAAEDADRRLAAQSSPTCGAG